MVAINSKILWLLLFMLPVTTQAASVRADYVVSFFPPSPCNNTSLGDLSDATLGGMLQFYAMSADGGDLVATNPGPPTVNGVACGDRLAGTFEFNLDLSAGAQLLYLSFDGALQSNPGPPISPLYAFLPGDDVRTAPDSAPVLPLGLISFDQNPGPPVLPLYAFASPGHEMGSLQISFSVVPIPGSLVLLVSGVMLLLGYARTKPVTVRSCG